MEIKQNLTTVNFNPMSNKTNKYIVVHYTGNSTDTAYNNTKYFKSVNRNASAHYFVDDNNIYQCVLDKDKAWHCGGGRQGSGGGTYLNICTNSNSIGIEMCCTNYGVSTATENRTVELVKYLMNKYKIPASNVIRHYDVTGKNCPAPMVSSSTRWNNFKGKLSGGANPTPSSNNATYTGTIFYKTFDNNKNVFLPTVTSKEKNNFAGNVGHSIGGIKAYCEHGNIYITCHIIGKPTNQWEETVVLNKNNYAANDGKSYSGIRGRKIDCVKIWSDNGFVEYRVSPVKQNYLGWIDSRNRNSGRSNAYAGIYGKEIDRIQMK